MPKVDCYKIAFDTQQEANERLRGMRAGGNGDKTCVKAYKCDECGLWHLTSYDSRRGQLTRGMRSSRILGIPSLRGD